MLTKEQILKVSRLLDQTGGSEGFYESNFDKRAGHALQHREKGEHTIELNLVCVELSCGDVVIKKATR